MKQKEKRIFKKIYCLKLLHGAFVCHCLLGLLHYCGGHKWLGQPGSLSGKLPLWDHLGLEINPPIMLPRFVPSHLLFAQLNRPVTKTEQEALPWMAFEAPPEKVFSSPVSCRSRASLCTVTGTMKLLENWRRDVRISQGALAVIPKYLVTDPPTKHRFFQTHGNCLESALGCSQLARADQGQTGTTKILAELLEGTEWISWSFFQKADGSWATGWMRWREREGLSNLVSGLRAWVAGNMLEIQPYLMKTREGRCLQELYLLPCFIRIQYGIVCLCKVVFLSSLLYLVSVLYIVKGNP